MLVQVGKRFVSEQREIDQLFAAGMKDVLSKSNVFKECHEDFLRDLIVSCNRKEYPGNRYIIEEGTRGDCMFVLYKGIVEVTSGGRYVCKLRDGSILGEAALLNIDNRRSASIRSVQKCDVAIIFRSNFHSILEKYPWEKRKFQRDMKAKLMELGKLIDAKEDINLEQHAMHCEAMKRVPFFADDEVMHDFVAELAINAVPRWYRPGKVIIQEGDMRCDEMYVLLRGAVEVTACGEFMGRLEDDLFGEIGVLDLLERRTASVVAATPCHCMLLTRQVVVPVLAKYPDARLRLLEHARQRLVALNAAVGGPEAVLDTSGARLPGCAVGFGGALKDADEDVRLFAACALLRDARVDLLQELSRRMTTRRYDDGKTIFTEGDAFRPEVDPICWVAQGQVEMWAGGRFVGLLGVGEVFGDTALFASHRDRATRRATVKSKGRVVLRVVGGMALHEVLKAYEDPALLAKWRAQIEARTEQLAKKAALQAEAEAGRRGERLDFTFMKLTAKGEGGLRVPVTAPLPALLDTCRSGASRSARQALGALVLAPLESG